MGYLAVIIAAVVTFAFGAVWYGVFSAPWKHDSRVTLGEDGNPINAKSPVPYVICFVALILVAGFLRLVLQNVGVASLGNALQWGLGVGLFFISPWIALNNGYATRPFRLTLIDGGYATIGCGLMAVVMWFVAPLTS